jgi:hypothetical protein
MSVVGLSRSYLGEDLPPGCSVSDVQSLPYLVDNGAGAFVVTISRLDPVCDYRGKSACINVNHVLPLLFISRSSQLNFVEDAANPVATK